MSAIGGTDAISTVRLAIEVPIADTHRFGIVAVDAQDRVLGIFTDGDLRRLIEKGQDLRALKAGEVMHARPRTIRQDALAVEAAEMMEAHRITSILVVDASGRLCGALNSNDLMRAKVI